MRSEFENYALWDNREANKHGNFATACISLMIPKSMNTSNFNKHYVEVEGVFLERLPSDTIQLGGCNVSTLRLIEGAPPILVREGK
ncbi:hypothetical protein NY98_12380 [Xanthomonas citri pv. fuscans]|uniref:Uncharacterized protein n=1 Tax=Xanthomonas citri pv. fuscans TaxID=366649 RepID=A0AB34Q6S5_XANCI|nr:hypothetical protein [Xanthomonas citri]ATS89998.1 hypothetical protein XcfCFBP6167P_18285 [Xanthomonas citri pv. phaseoli var. fuscans]AZU17509.1 hypothetical protein AC613_10515 [Xanthomonas citri pv. fuscans]AZU21568.1 hypothetical protein AC612_10515 [Xanthomonas citri pv. fuscans]AZU92772.1 hypothetical protein AC614_10520 [Xanthomonas citri pv. fuscans]KGU52528.1 hypothetical protein NY98_12380 [Xanthomonas citri pv. fuscans]